MRPVGRHKRLIAAAVAPLLLSACAREPMTVQGEKIATLYNIVLVIALLIGAGVYAMILLSAIRYRKKPGDDTLPPQTHGNTTFEVVWTLVPTVIALGLFGMSFAAIRAIDQPKDSYAAVIEVKGYQWSWTFDYGTNANGVRVLVQTPNNREAPQMMVPVGETVHVEERTDNVLHSFFVPDFLFKRDLVPGKANGFDLTVTSPGIYEGQCAELCGTEHALMTFTVKAVGRAEFDKWFNEFVPPRPKCEDTAKAATEVTIRSIEARAEFTDPCAYGKAGAPLTINFVNGGGMPHNVVLVEGIDNNGSQLASTPVVNGSSEKSTAQTPALEAGKEYTFFCVVHPLMAGKFVAV
ncbi:MAG TPA: cytochrome c oxidase subunit II [Frankiaceae bacterium]|nr:cytochrome c oxidase subunit II [Frankiaceae bacterium]